MRTLGPIKVVPVSADEPLRPIQVEERYTGVLLVVMSGGSVVGEIRLPALTVIPPDLQRRLIAQRCGDRLWRKHLAAAFLDAARPADPALEGGGAPTVSVIVCTRDRPDQLVLCLESLLALDTKPDEILVVDNSPTTDATRLLYAELPVRYVLEELPGQSRARNRGILETTGELIAFTDDDAQPDPGWLTALCAGFAAQEVGAVTGLVAPAELGTKAQALFEDVYGGMGKGLEPRIFSRRGQALAFQPHVYGAGCNMAFRTEVLRELGASIRPRHRHADRRGRRSRRVSAGDRVPAGDRLSPRRACPAHAPANAPRAAAPAVRQRPRLLRGVLCRVRAGEQPRPAPARLPPDALKPLYQYNPMANLIESQRGILLEGKLPSALSVVAVAAAAVAVLAAGVAVFAGLRHALPECTSATGPTSTTTTGRPTSSTSARRAAEASARRADGPPAELRTALSRPSSTFPQAGKRRVRRRAAGRSE